MTGIMVKWGGADVVQACDLMSAARKAFEAKFAKVLFRHEVQSGLLYEAVVGGSDRLPLRWHFIVSRSAFDSHVLSRTATEAVQSWITNLGTITPQQQTTQSLIWERIPELFMDGGQHDNEIGFTFRVEAACYIFGSDMPSEQYAAELDD